jgi:hypothetical protein
VTSGGAVALLARARTWASDRSTQVDLIIAGGLAFALIYFVSFGSLAWHPTDYEQTYGYAWRVIHGEVPYRDFIYHKPPGTPFLHAVWMLFPDDLQVRASRLFFYLQISLPAVLPAAWAVSRGRVPFGWRLPCLVAAGALLAAHNFPLMPWPTTDGAMFASIGAVAWAESWTAPATRRAPISRAIASSALVLAVLCKQSFFPLCIAFGGVTVFDLVRAAWKWRRSGAPLRPALVTFAASALPALGIGALFVGGLAAAGAWSDFRAQMGSQSTLDALWEFGFTGWPMELIWVVPATAFLPLLRLWDGGLRGVGGWVARGGALLLLLGLAQFTLAHPDTGYGVLGHVGFFVLLGTFLGRLGAALLSWDLSRRYPGVQRADPVTLVLHLFFVVTAFSCRLSLGYQTPVLGLAGLGLVLHEVFPEERHPLEALPVLLAVAGIGSALWQANADRPYRDGARATLTRNLGELFPKLSGIRTAQGNFDRYADLKDVVTRYARGANAPYALTQDYPGIHWLMGDRNPIALDWCYYLDIPGFEPRLISELERTGALAIVPKESDAPWATGARPGPCERLDLGRHNAVSRTVVNTWHLIGQSPYFCVYQRT